MWDLPRPGLEPVSPALAGGFLTTVLPGKPQHNVFDLHMLCVSVLHSFILLSSMVRLYCNLFIPSLIDRHSYYFQFGATITKATYECSCSILYKYVFISLGYTLKNGIAVSRVKYIFNFIRNSQTILQHGGTFLHSHQHYMRVPVFPHLHQHLVLSFFSPSSGGKMASPYGFNLHLPDDY